MSAAAGYYSTPRPISEADDVATFDSGEPLDEYLRKRALANHVQGASRCFVTCRDGPVVGFYALASAAIDRDSAPGQVRRNMPDPVPVILLSRLAVDRKEQGNGLGSHLLRDAITRSIRVAEHVGVRAILVHALHDEARAFYAHFEFESSPTDPLHLVLSMKDARALVGGGASPVGRTQREPQKPAEAQARLAAARARLQALDKAVAAGKVCEDRHLWGGAGLVVDTTMPEPPYREAKYVVTPYAASLSWLVRALWAACRPLFDSMTKFEFFGRLANAALRSQQRAGSGENARYLLGAVVHEAFEIVGDIENGRFKALPVAIAGEVHDDQLPNSEHDDALSDADIEQWFKDGGFE